MTDQQKREFVSQLYPGPRWAKKVAKMSDAQVYAIWIKNQEKEEPTNEKPDNTDIPF